MNGNRSPLFYVGDKYKLMPQLLELFPNDIETYYDVFTGGGSTSMNVAANKYVMNDLNEKVIELHRFLISGLKEPKIFLKHEYEMIDYFGLTRSSAKKLPNDFEAIKKKYNKTYFANINKSAYIKMRETYNNDKSRMDLLYLLVIFGFNHMIRFNSKGDFNLPVGNVDWNFNVEKALSSYEMFAKFNSIELFNDDFEDFVSDNNYNENDFLYFDPPYLITFSEYNKNWNENTEKRLYKLLDNLNDMGIQWGLSNVLFHKGKSNNILRGWSERYRSYPVKANYISHFDNTIKTDTSEVYVTNVGLKKKNGR